MRRSRTLDWFLVATLVPAWLAVLGVHLERGIGARGGLGFAVTSAPDASGFPIVNIVFVNDALWPGSGFLASRPRAGDRILRVDDFDLRGASAAEFIIRAGRRETGPITLELERNGQRFETAVERVRNPVWWASIPFCAGMVLCAAILLLRARSWRLARRFFVAAVLLAIGWDATTPGEVDSHALAFATTAGLGAGSALLLSIWWEITDSALPLRGWQRAQVWLLGFAISATMAWQFWLPFPADVHVLVPVAVVFTLFALSCLLAITRAYWRSDALERRQLRWILLGLYAGTLPLGVAMALLPFTPLSGTLLSLSVIAQAALPIGILVSVLGYRLFDVDRIWSATASYTVLAILVVAGALALTPRVAGAIGASLGVSATASQWLVSLALAAIAIPAHRKLRPWLDRRMFAERVAVERGLEQLVADLAGCATPRELVRRVGEQIDSLLEPESIATYAREEGAFTPVFARGQAVPPAFEADGLLAKALDARATPLSARSAELGSFDRAALETLHAEVIVPTRRGASLVAFTCLGRKRSGDIYTPAELALLAAVAIKSGELLQRMSSEEILSEARAMQESLRRYVPGAVAERLQRGAAVDSGEVEVSVLFVDVRGYTSFAEARRPEDVFSTLNEHTERVSTIVRERGGAVVEFNGDGMMAVFGAPDPLAEKERRAVEAAREIVAKVAAGLSVGVGVATGPAYVGNIRAADRWIWSVIGSTTNLAARLQALTRDLDASIAIDAPTQLAAGWVCSGFVRHDSVPIRGRSERTVVWALPLAAG